MVEWRFLLSENGFVIFTVFCSLVGSLVGLLVRSFVRSFLFLSVRSLVGV